MALREQMGLLSLQRLDARFLTIVLFTLLSANVHSQQSDTLFKSKIISVFDVANTIPNEKLYLHTDRSVYNTGDTIWFEAYLVNAKTLMPSVQSKYVYVELANRKNQVIQRRKIEKRTDNTFPGFLCLPNNIEEGDYYIRAFSHWMKNDIKDYFFYKNIKVEKDKLKEISIDIRYDTDNDKRTAKICFRRGYDLIKRCNVDYMVRTKATGNLFMHQQTNEFGEIKINIPTKKELDQYIYVILEDEHGMRHKRTFYVPDVFDYHVDFFPEGGDLIFGSTQKIAFKALGSDGNSVSVSGTIIDSEGDSLVKYQSEYKGMGAFLLTINNEKPYKAVTTCYYQGKEYHKTFDLPTSKKDAFALSITMHKNKAYYKILSYGETQKVFYLIGQMRGQLLFVQQVSQNQGVLDNSNIPNGILSLTLIDEKMVPFSERILFLYKPQTECEISLANKGDDPDYVDLDISMMNSRKSIVSGHYSLSVTNDQTVHVDSFENNIISQMLLTSELHGNIESPGYYFKKEGLRSQVLIDNLMLTHGWSRFRTKDIIQEKQTVPIYYMEVGQAISGKVTTGSNKPSSNSQVLIKINGKTYPPVQTNEKGVFVLNNVSYQDTSFVEAFIIEKNKLIRSSIVIDKDDFPELSNRNNYESMDTTIPKENEQTTIYSKKNADGTWEFSLPEIKIVARTLVKEKFSSYKLNDEEMIRQQNAKTALDLVQKLPGFQIINNRPYLNPKQSLRPEMRMSNDVNNRNILRPTGKNDYGKTVRFVLDNRSIPYNMLSSISAEDIISVYKIDPEVDAALGYAQNHKAIEEAYMEALENGASLEELDELEIDQQIRNFKDGDFRTSGGCIVLSSRKGNMRLPKDDSRGDAAFLQGYNKYKEFFVPKYSSLNDDKRIKEPRNTIYWQPRVSVDNNGKIHVKYYTFGNNGLHTLILEGISSEGEPCHYEWKINSNSNQITE